MIPINRGWFIALLLELKSSGATTNFCPFRVQQLGASTAESGVIAGAEIKVVRPAGKPWEGRRVSGRPIG
jgi:hypothetical protein